MKVSASPFEAPVGTTRSIEKASVKTKRDGRESSIHLVRSPAASQSVRAGLDSATKEALKELADRVEGSSDESSEQTSEHSGQPQDHEADHRRREDHAKHLSGEHGGKSREPLEPSSLQTEPQVLAAVVRLQDRFELARMRRGREVYRQVLRDQAMSQIEEQFRENLESRATLRGTFNEGGLTGGLDDALESILEFGADFLESEKDAKSFEDTKNLLAPRASLKRVA